jgi:hypothetical protein
MFLSLSLAVPYLVSWLSASAPVQCTVEVQGMPAGQLRYHVEPAAAKVSFPLEGDEAVRLVGPRYAGEWIVSTAACAAGTVPLQASPLPALVIFHCAPEVAAVLCRGCSPAVDGRYHDADEFPAFPMTGFRREVQFVLKAARYQDRTIRAVVNPGRNEFDGRLVPR